MNKRLPLKTASNGEGMKYINKTCIFTFRIWKFTFVIVAMSSAKNHTMKSRIITHGNVTMYYCVICKSACFAFGLFIATYDWKKLRDKIH